MPRLRKWLVIPLERLDPPVSTPLAAAWLGGLGLLLLLAVGFSWHITRPLTRLADAADRLAAGQPQRVDPAGPTETGRWASVSTPCWTRWPNRIPCGARCWPGCRA